MRLETGMPWDFSSASVLCNIKENGLGDTPCSLLWRPGKNVLSVSFGIELRLVSCMRLGGIIKLTR